MKLCVIVALFMCLCRFRVCLCVLAYVFVCVVVCMCLHLIVGFVGACGRLGAWLYFVCDIVCVFVRCVCACVLCV